MVGSYHQYLARCSHMMQQGVTVSDVLYLTPEGAPHVFRAPDSALDGAEGWCPDKKGYGFDACSPKLLMDRAKVKDGLITFKDGSSYRLMVLPQVETMTPGLLAKIKDLVKAGATVVGNPPVKSPSLSNYPDCDEKVQKLAKDLWGSLEAPKTATTRAYGKGALHWGGELSPKNSTLYPAYEQTAAILKSMGVVEDFTATGPVRYGHRRAKDRDIFFVSNRSGEPIKAVCRFRVMEGKPELWDPVTGDRRALPQFERKDGTTTIPMEFDAFQSFFVVFGNRSQKSEVRSQNGEKNFPELKQIQELIGSWTVQFDPKWGGSTNAVVFNELTDWSTQSDPVIKYYSGKATYRKTFELPQVSTFNFSLSTFYLSLGPVYDLARVKLNGKDLGVVWCAPWRVDISSAVKAGKNELEIEVVNLWPNRLIGDLAKPEEQRLTWTIVGHGHKADSKLLPSGLLGPVRLMTNDNVFGEREVKP
jgi:hypothetical protein